MSEAEKEANDLIESFKCWRHVWNRTECDYVSEIDYPAMSKYALICVDKILETAPQKENEIFGISKGVEFWQEVKQILTNK